VKFILFSLVLFQAPPGDVSDAEQLLKVVSYDRNLPARTPDGLRLLILFDPENEGSRSSAALFRDDLSALGGVRGPLAPASVEMAPFAGEAALYRDLVAKKISAVFVAEGLSLPEVVRAAEEAGVMTLAGNVADVEKGLVAGIHRQGDARKIVVNMGAAERSGVDLDPAVRQVAQRAASSPPEPERRGLIETLSRYRDAVESKDMAALRALWPGLSADEAKRIQASMATVRSQQVFLALLRIETGSGRVRARVRRVDHLVTPEGEKLVSGRLMEVAFARTDTGLWVIESMGSVSPTRAEAP
jgi:hypothetical protein